MSWLPPDAWAPPTRRCRSSAFVRQWPPRRFWTAAVRRRLWKWASKSVGSCPSIKWVVEAVEAILGLFFFIFVFSTVISESLQAVIFNGPLPASLSIFSSFEQFAVTSRGCDVVSRAFASEHSIHSWKLSFLWAKSFRAASDVFLYT